ncbi:MAG: hypothetical protein IJ190_07295 [Prevotella sp.]|nr:hypothetical protein [Prevotella sp.]
MKNKMQYIILGVCAILILAGCAACKNVAQPMDGSGMVNGGDSLEERMLDGPSMEYLPTEHDQKMNVMIRVRNFVDSVYNKEIRKVVNDKGEHGSDINFDEAFASKAWQKAVAAIIDKDRGIDGIGFFDHDYWLMSQDIVESFYASDIKVENIVIGDNPSADAVLQLHRNDDISNLRLHIIWEDNSWKVDNMIDFSPTMGKAFNYRERMKEYLEE